MLRGGRPWMPLPLLLGALCAVAVLVAGCAANQTGASLRPGQTGASPSAPPVDAGAGHCDHPAPDWDQVAATPTGVVEGFTSTDSAAPGDPVGLYVSTTSPRWRVQAYRMGFYPTGAGACLVWTSPWRPGVRQAEALIVGTTHTPTAPWTVSMTVDTAGWAPGDYLLRIDGGTPALRSFMPLTIRSPSLAGRVVLVMPDTTWQAYNLWGGYSLYFGPDHTFAGRARAVSFDRPYSYGRGAADFIADDLPLVSLAESLGLAIGYVTDVDLDRDPEALGTAAAIVSVGHDEYYSPGMRQTLTQARDRGVNLAFFGANDIYRKIRFDDTALGPRRLEINYKDASDPIGVPSLVTTQWRDPPSDQPESALTGEAYRCAATGETFDPIVVADAASWIFAGTGVTDGTVLPAIAGHEFDGVDARWPMPRPLQVLFHGVAHCGGSATSQDSTYYTTPSGAGVLDVGAYFWTCAIDDTCRVGVTAAARQIVSRISVTYLRAAAAGPLGRTHPAVDTVGTFYPSL